MKSTKKQIFKNYYKIKNFKFHHYADYFFAKSILIKFWDFKDNWGDSVNPYLISKVAGVKVLSDARIFNFLDKEKVLGIGSIISGDLRNTVIWGSGFIHENAKIKSNPKKILALRGKLTGKKIIEHGLINPEVYGDPALLFPSIYHPKVSKKYSLGLIPHFTEMGLPELNDIQNHLGEELKIIDIRNGIEEFATEVLSCENIFSSSLHGLILAEAYGIPTCKINISKNLIGGDFKFRDYYSGVGINKYDEINVNSLFNSNKKLVQLTSQKDLNFDADSLKRVLINHVIEAR